MMDMSQKKCQVKVKKIDFGEKPIQRCVIPVRKLDVNNKNKFGRKLPKSSISPIQVRKLTVLIQKLNSCRLHNSYSSWMDGFDGPSRMSKVKLVKLSVLRKLDLKRSGLDGMHSSQRLRILLQKLNLDKYLSSTSSLCRSENNGFCKSKDHHLLGSQLQGLRVLLRKLKMSRKEPPQADSRTVSTFQLKKLNVLLRKVKLQQVRQDKAQTSSSSDVASSSHSCPGRSHPFLKKQQFRVLIKKLKLRREIQERLDHTIFLDDKLGFVVNPYLIPGFHRDRTINRRPVKVLKIGRRSRASRCRVRIRKLQL